MEIKINREIRNYTEAIFFGLSMRQFVFSVLAAAVALLLYFLLRPLVGSETVSWMCILGAAPFAVMGFVSYHGMTAEQFLWAWLRSEVIEPKELRFEAVNLYYETMKTHLENQKKEDMKHHDENAPAADETGEGTVQCSAQSAGRHPHPAHLE